MNEFDKILSSVSINDNIRYTTPEWIKLYPQKFKYGIVDDILIDDISETILLKIRKNNIDDVDEIEVRDYIIFNLTRKCFV